MCATGLLDKYKVKKIELKMREVYQIFVPSCCYSVHNFNSGRFGTRALSSFQEIFQTVKLI